MFGRSGQDLLPAFSQGAAGVKVMQQKAHDLGVTFNNETIKPALDAQDSIENLGQAFEGLKFSIGQDLAPALTGFLNNMISIIEKVSDWIKQNPELVKDIFLMARVILQGLA